MMPILSICIPACNCADRLAPRVRAWLALDCRDFEIVVSDNASPDGTANRLRALGDGRLVVLENETNLGGWENGMRALLGARGKYALALTDKDDIAACDIPTAVAILKRIDVPVGRFRLWGNDKSADGVRFLAWPGLRFTHPSGFFYRTDLFRESGLVDKIRPLDECVRAFNTDFQVLFLCRYGAFADVPFKLVEYKSLSLAGKQRSLTYAENEDLWLAPKFRQRVAGVYLKQLSAAGCPLERRNAIVRNLVSLLGYLSTYGFLGYLRNEKLRAWYGISDEYYQRQNIGQLKKSAVVGLLRLKGIGFVNRILLYHWLAWGLVLKDLFKYEEDEVQFDPPGLCRRILRRIREILRIASGPR